MLSRSMWTKQREHDDVLGPLLNNFFSFREFQQHDKKNPIKDSNIHARAQFINL